MTDARVSAAVAQALTQINPNAQISTATAQVFTKVNPNAQISAAVAQVLTSPITYAPAIAYVRTAGSSRPLLLKHTDSTWIPVKSVGQ